MPKKIHEIITLNSQNEEDLQVEYLDEKNSQNLEEAINQAKNGLGFRGNVKEVMNYLNTYKE